MAIGQIHVGDVGTAFIATIKDENDAVVDISGATLMRMLFRKPDNSLLTKTATHYTDGTDGKMKYVSVANDLDDDGNWKVQAYVELAGGSWHSDISDFRVCDNV